MRNVLKEIILGLTVASCFLLAVLPVLAADPPASIQAIAGPYQKIRDALDNNSLSGVADNAKAISDAAEKDPTLPKELASEARDLAGATDLRSARLAFFPLADTFGQLLISLGLDDRQAEIKTQIEKMDHATPSQEALDRKSRSNSLLKQRGVTIDKTLSPIADSILAKHRSKEEIAKRAIAICITALKGEGLEQDRVDSLVNKYGAKDYLSPNEAAFIANQNPSQQDKTNFAWRYEDYWVLLWALGYVDTLDFPNDECDVKIAVNFLATRSTQQFIDDAKLRDISQILDQADLIYRYDWAAVDARVKQKPAPGSMDSGVVMERHYVLNWLIGYMNQAWDDVSTDT